MNDRSTSIACCLPGLLPLLVILLVPVAVRALEGEGRESSKAKKRIDWTVPNRDLAYVKYVAVGPGVVGLGDDSADLPYVGELKAGVLVPAPVLDKFVISHRLTSDTVFISDTGGSRESDRAQIDKLYFNSYIMSLVFISKPTLQHVVTLGAGYGGDYRSFGHEGMRYVAGYMVRWNNGEDLSVGAGLTLAHIYDLYLPIPLLTINWRVRPGLLLKLLLPSGMTLRYSPHTRVALGVFSRLDTKRMYVTEVEKEVGGGTLRRESGEFRMFRIELGPEIMVRLWKIFFLKLEGGLCLDLGDTFPAAYTVDQNGNATSDPEKPETQTRLTWFAGAGLAAVF